MPATERFFRDQKKLHVIFAWSSVALLLSVIAMMVEDYADPWRDYQRTNFDLQAVSKKRAIELQKTRLEAPARLRELDQAIQAAEAENDAVRAAHLKKERESLLTEYKQTLKELGIKQESDQDYVSLKSQLESVERQLDFESRLKAAREKGNQDEVEEFQYLLTVQKELEQARNAAQRRVDALETKLKNQNAIRDEKRADYDLAVRDGLSEDVLKKLKAAYYAAQAKCDEIQLELEAAKEELKSIGDPELAEDERRREALVTLRDLNKKRDELTKAVSKLEADLRLAESALEKIKPEKFWMKAKRRMMELPIIEGFNGHLKVAQDWIPELKQPLGMTKIARFDRCRTCHLNVDLTAPGNRPAFPHGTPSDLHDVSVWVKENKFPHPFATHPQHSLYVTASSPHPVSKFGCTVCHDGQGSGTDFNNAEHSPNDPWQHHEWHDEYGYHPNHFWEYPMQPERFQESTCIKCHHQVVELGVNPRYGESAPKVVKGFNLIQRYGCFGCHEIHGFDGGKPIGPDMRLEPQTAEQKQRIAEDPTQVAGKYRKVGPSLRHIAAKTTADFVAYWTQDPQRYRPSTKMPKFFGITGHLDPDDTITAKYEAVELAGIARVLISGSENIDLLKPADGYEPNVERGKKLFTERGCMACHQHQAIENGTKPDFGPNISDIHRKVRRNEGNAGFSDWLYTWLREPTRYHTRTRMPNLYLDAYQEGDESIDPAADIVAWLLSQGDAEDFAAPTADSESLDALVTLYLKKARFSTQAVQKILESRRFPQKLSDVKGDETVLATEDGSAIAEDQWDDVKLRYVGRKTISRYGCYGCHDIPGYEDARPIGVALQDWGRKDTSKLGLEHIEEFLHHHGEPDGSSTLERVENAIAMARDGSVPPEKLEPELTHAYFYESLIHHGRPGFIWQKLRAPRSYDYLKTGTKGYDERLRMPQFPLKPDEIEAISTFVLGLVAEPPSEQYIYSPDEREKTRIEGEFLLAKYNCTGCHMVELPEITFGVDVENDISPTNLEAPDVKRAIDLLLSIHKPRQALTGQEAAFTVEGEDVTLPLASFHGMLLAAADPEEDPDYQETTYTSWETLDFGEGDDAVRVLPNTSITVVKTKEHSIKSSRGGEFAQWLVGQMSSADIGTPKEVPARKNAWQASPPPLHKEGYKVQTAWLHQFLLNPERVRHATVLRMPQFNMSSEEAAVLANYFAAADGAPFPYIPSEAASEQYLAQREAQLRQQGLLDPETPYLDMAWRTLNGLTNGIDQPITKDAKCIGCHSLAGLEYSPKPGDTTPQGPDLRRVEDRLRPDWVQLWLYNPAWTTPYTAMPNNFPESTKGQVPALFGGDPNAQVIGVRDALMNYSKLMEAHGIPKRAEASADTADQPAAEE